MLIIYAHPNHKGHCGYTLKYLTQRLLDSKIKHELLDLYKLNYNPIISDKEHYTSGGDKVEEDTKNFQAKVKKAKNIVFIYLTW